MQIYNNLNFCTDTPCVLALGCFDGVHLGHRAVINAAKKIATEHGLPLGVFTFATPPRNFFLPDSVPMICTTEDKLALLESLGVDICICVPCNNDIFSIEPEEFVSDIIFSCLCASHIVCGYNYSFGKGGKGNPALIDSICKKRGAALTVIDEQIINGLSVSSSLVRLLVANGDVAQAATLLGRPHFLTSEVVDGQHLARTLGFPTVNTIPPHGLLLPKRGVYVSRVSFGDTFKYGITNIGIRPTVGTEILCAETHIFDFEGNLYGRKIKTEFLRFLRAEKKFSSVEEMAEQIHKDINTAKDVINNLKG